MKGTKIKFTSMLALVSILGFLTVFMNAFTNIEIGPWVDGLIFIVIGTGLAIISSIWSVAEYMKNGLTNDEIAHIVTSVVGLMSVFVGLLTLPIEFLQSINIPQFDGIKGIVAIFAIIFIVIEAWLAKR